MIRLHRPPSPPKLDSLTIAALTQEFIADKTKPVWSKSYIRDPLREMSHEKCAYCETKVDEESKYMEVDHFQHKDLYPLRVVEWANLLPSCKKCNGSKGTHDVVANPIIDPSITDPRCHLKLHFYRFGGLDEIGKSTIDILSLNDHDRRVKPRFVIGDGVYSAIDNLMGLLESYKEKQIGGRKNKLKSGMRALLSEAVPSSQYSATAATVLVQNPDFWMVKEEMEVLDLWEQEMETALVEVKTINY